MPRKRSSLFTMPMETPCTLFIYLPFSPLPWVVYSWYFLSVFLFTPTFKIWKTFVTPTWPGSFVMNRVLMEFDFGGVRLLPFLASLEESVDEGGSNFFAFFYFPFDPYSVKSLQYY